MNTNNAQLLLENTEIKALLKELILEKADRYDSAMQQVLSEKEIETLLTGNLTLEALHKVIDHYEVLDELAILNRDLSSMCYQLNKSDKKIPDNTKWERSYQYATQVVQIGDVVSNLLGLTNFNKNIRCPFHEDKSPSLKVYVKSNFFICFGCGVRGSPIDFVMKNKNCSFREAVLYLSNS